MNKKENYQRRYLRIFWGLFILPLVFLFILFFLISKGVMGPMPSFEQLENPKTNLASELYSVENEVVGKYFYGSQNRTSIDFKSLSPNMVNALLAIEDIRYKKHSGIDPIGLGRVLFKTILLDKSAGGGSTITQQLAKNLFGRDTTSYDSDLMEGLNLAITKFKEWITAVRLERNYTKREILVMYLNTVFFGSHSYGIKTAAKTYFNTSPESLKVEEAALLAGIVKAPTRYNPVRNPEQAKKRRNVVMEQMEKYEFITPQQCDSLQNLSLNLDYTLDEQNEGLIPYLRSHIRELMEASKPRRSAYSSFHNYRFDSLRWARNPLYGWLAKHKKPDGSPYNLDTDGLKIYTTINADMQRYARKAVRQHLGENLQKKFFRVKRGKSKGPFSEDLSEEQVDTIMERTMKSCLRYKRLKRQGLSHDSIVKIFHQPVEMQIFTYEGPKDTVMTPMDSLWYYKYILRTGFMSMNPHTGHIKAYVGGPDYRYFKYDHVIQSKRQVGSTIKPFLYTVAMQEGYDPCHKVPNVAQSFTIEDTTWSPTNAGETGMEGEMVTLKWGLVNSVNYISAWLVKQFNSQAVVDIMKRMGVTSQLRAVPSIILGTSELSLYEMVGAYSTYANKGVHVKPVFVTRIEDRSGNIISEFKPRKREGISERTAHAMIELLQDVVDEGTAVRLRSTYDFRNEIAGKTGTTQNQSDGWFMGVTPNLVSGVWVGGEYRAIHFNSIRYGQGANMALPIWAKYMEQVYNDSTLDIARTDSFPDPKGIHIDTDCETSFSSSEKDEYEIMDREF